MLGQKATDVFTSQVDTTFMSFNSVPERDAGDVRDSIDDDEEAYPHVDGGDHIVSADSASGQEASNTESFDPFVPLDSAHTGPVINIVTPRAILLGSLCGALVNASNIYLGLRAGWTTSANILGAIVGFSVLRKWAARSDQSFGPHENNIVQTVATASGGMSNVFISAIPALYQLGLLRTPVLDFFRIVLLTAVGGYFGLLSIVPLRKFFIQHVARELNLVFPSSMATAITIRNMHSAADGEDSSGRKLKAMLYAFGGAMALRIVSQYALGLLWDWHIFTWSAGANIAPSLSIAAESWGWFIEWSPAMMGSGMLVDFGVASSFFAGSVLAWGIIGPYLVAKGIAFGQLVSTNEPGWSDLTSYKSMSIEFASKSHPSPRYWLLWPGVACTLAVAFVELACQWRVFWKFSVISIKAIFATFRRLLPKMEKHPSYEYDIVAGEEKVVGQDDASEIPPPTEHGAVEEEDIATWMWAPGALALVVLAILLTYMEFDMSPLEAVLALFLSFCMSLVAIQATGATDTTPLNAISKVSQVVLSGVTRASGGSVVDAQRLNLLGAGLTNISANQGVDLIGDFRVGFLLRTPPRLQYVAQLIGTLVATLVAPSMFVLFTTAYPCIIDSSEEEGAGARSCEFPGPSVAAWRAVAVAASEPTTPIPPSSAYFSIALAAGAGLLAVFKRFVLVGRLQHVQRYLPNMMILALAFTLPSPQNGVTMLMGAVAAKIWRWKNSVSFEKYGYAVAAGLVAGEGIGGTINCVLSIVGVGGQQWSTGIGCPASEC
ncbi:OPT oligopeptide transporter protein-domain-containing protein [Xylariales sp. AK1849]|nr:OPT oligopeptide transporter protein-domain-containing protein [Xylariales sp. AK1849]